MRSKFSGLPLKDRGIHWEEKYGEKSTYLKQQYEEQVGPGSYFRWEGHDSSTGEDYYVVVTPGYSKKKGFHFFAALRKMPANDGASGKKFKTQAEALGHAFETWRVPPPKTKPHKPYIANDLKGKPIVMENIHGATMPSVIRTSTRIIIDASMIRTAAEKRSGTEGLIFPDHWGELDIATHSRNMALMNLILNRGAANNCDKQWLLIDTKDQENPAYTPDGKRAAGYYPGYATCTPPSDAVWKRIMSDNGVGMHNKLFNISKTMKEGQSEMGVEFFPPLMQGHPGYKTISFEDVVSIQPFIMVDKSKKAAFDAAIKTLSTKLKSRLVPEEPVSIIPFADGKGQEVTEELLKNGKYRIRLSCPADNFAELKHELVTKAKLGAIPKLDFLDENAMNIYTYFAKKGMLNDPASIENVKKTPVFEEVRAVKGQMVFYDETGWPLGIKPRASSGVDPVSGEPIEIEDTQFVFRPGVVENWLKMPEVNGNLEALRMMLMNNHIAIRREDVADSKACKKISRAIMGEYPEVKNGIPAKNPDGTLKLENKKMMDPYAQSSQGGMVRVFNPEKRVYEVVPLPAEAARQQTVPGVPVVLPAGKTFFYLPGKDGKPTPTSAGETTLYDANSAGQLMHGTAYTLMGRLERESARKEGAKRRQAGLAKDGFFFGARKYMGELGYLDFLKKKGAAGTVADIWKQHQGTLYSIMTPNGKLEVPPDWQADPKYREHPAVQYLSNPSNPVFGYYYVTNKAYGATPFLTSEPTDDAPIKQPYMERQDGRAVDSGKPPLVITKDDVIVTWEGAKKKVYFKEFKKGVEYLKAKYGMTDAEVGAFTDITVDDINAAEERASEIDAKPDNMLAPEERLYRTAMASGNTVAPDVLAQITGIDPNNPAEFQARNGTLYEIKSIGGEAPAEVAEKTFASRSRAEAIKAHMELAVEAGGNGYAPGSLHIVEYTNVELAPSAFQARKAGKPKQMTLNTQLIGQENVPYGEEYEDPNAVEEMPETPMTPELPPDQQPVEEAEIIDDTEPVLPPAPAPAQAPVQAPIPPAPQPTVPQAKPAAVPAPVPPKPKPQRRTILDPMEQTTPPAVQASVSVENLIRLADDLDRRGMHEKADAIDNILSKFLKGKGKD